MEALRADEHAEFYQFSPYKVVFTSFAALKADLRDERNTFTKTQSNWTASGWGTTGFEAYVDLKKRLADDEEELELPSEAPGVDGRPHDKHSHA